MKLLALLMLGVVALSAAAPKVEKVEAIEQLPFEIAAADASPETRNILINILIRQLFTFIRYIINNGSSIFGLPPLDPLNLENLHIYIPAGLINLDLEMEDVYSSGVGGFVVHRSNLVTRPNLTFDIDISVPSLVIKAGKYNLLGDVLTALPLYGNGEADFLVEGFRFQGLLILKQSEDGNSVLIERIENAAFQIPSLKSQLTGVIGGGDIDNVVNAIVEEVVLDYINRFSGAIALLASRVIVAVGNPILDQLDTWRFIAPFV
ncbi:uncharacterized protein LOC126381805 [Pectinophora gossypiella]|uniref:Hemolymph juvenile hormone binding protein n=2 Tax=Pectinophora gossypiella TaxID=13191 RepID=A0A1E1W8Y0_PECGO|nr:uncharacterized protein LOC126381805 [Pectinophora gossypiella]